MSLNYPYQPSTLLRSFNHLELDLDHGHDLDHDHDHEPELSLPALNIAAFIIFDLLATYDPKGRN